MGHWENTDKMNNELIRVLDEVIMAIDMNMTGCEDIQKLHEIRQCLENIETVKKV